MNTVMLHIRYTDYRPIFHHFLVKIHKENQLITIFSGLMSNMTRQESPGQV